MKVFRHRRHRVHRRSRGPQACASAATTCARSSAPREGRRRSRRSAASSIRRPLRHRRDPRRHGGLRRGHPRRRRLRGRDPQVRAPGDVRGQRARHRERAGAALDAKTPKVVYISTVGAFGNTHGEVVDESYEHPGTDFTSYYEQTKYEAHRVAKRLIAEEGLPCVIVAARRRLRARRPLGDRDARSTSSSPGRCR